MHAAIEDFHLRYLSVTLNDLQYRGNNPLPKDIEK